MKWIKYKDASGTEKVCDENVWAIIQKSPSAVNFKFIEYYEPNQASSQTNVAGATNKPVIKKSGCGCGK